MCKVLRSPRRPLRSPCYELCAMRQVLRSPRRSLRFLRYELCAMRYEPSPPLLQLYNLIFQRIQYCLGAISNINFAENIRKMILDRLLAQK